MDVKIVCFFIDLGWVVHVDSRDGGGGWVKVDSTGSLAYRHLENI